MRTVGDEFTFILREMPEPQSAGSMAQNLVGSIGASMALRTLWTTPHRVTSTQEVDLPLWSA